MADDWMARMDRLEALFMRMMEQQRSQPIVVNVNVSDVKKKKNSEGGPTAAEQDAPAETREMPRPYVS